MLKLTLWIVVKWFKCLTSVPFPAGSFTTYEVQRETFKCTFCHVIILLCKSGPFLLTLFNYNIWMLYPTSSLFPLSGRGSWVGCSRTRCGCGSCPRGWPWRPGPTRPRSSRTLSHKCEVKMGNGSLSIFYQICWCTGHQIQSEKNSVKVKIFSNLCCPNLWGGSPVLLQFSLWNHLVDLKEISS